MATRFYGIDIGGQRAKDVTVAASTNSTDVELAVDDTNIDRAASFSKLQIQMALEALCNRVMEDFGY